MFVRVTSPSHYVKAMGVEKEAVEEVLVVGALLLMFGGVMKAITKITINFKHVPTPSHDFITFLYF